MSVGASGIPALPLPGSDDHRTIGERLQDDGLIQAAMSAAWHQVVLDHLRTGRPLVCWRDGRVVKVSAEEVTAQLGLT